MGVFMLMLMACPQCGNRWSVFNKDRRQVITKEETEVETYYPVRHYRTLRSFENAGVCRKNTVALIADERDLCCRKCGASWKYKIVRRERIPMTQLSSQKVVEPFGEVNVWTQPDGTLRIKATILMVPTVEGAETGLAIDGSASMKEMFGAGGVVSALFAPTTPNLVEPVARTLAAYLAGFDSDGKTTVIYWACGPGGNQIQEVGDMDADKARACTFPPPKQFGTGTKLLPALKYFVETRYAASPWAIFVFVTDGILEDLSDVQQYSISLAKDIASGKRQFVKLVLIGVGAEVDEGQMELLDDLDYGGLKDQAGQIIDLWDHKLAADMQKIEEIFAEVVSSDTILASSAKILDNNGNPVKPIDRQSYDDGLPALLDFVVPAGVQSFTLILPNGNTIVQPLS